MVDLNIKIKPADTLTKEVLWKLLYYNHNDGEFYWINNGHRGRHANRGEVAGTKHRKGYITIRVKGKQYLAHRLVFLYMHGYIPQQIDHINRNRDDNRLFNLRITTDSENRINCKTLINNKSGYRGVSWDKTKEKWVSYISKNKKRTFIGYFKCKHNAFCEYVIKSRELFGEFSPL